MKQIFLIIFVFFYFSSIYSVNHQNTKTATNVHHKGQTTKNNLKSDINRSYRFIFLKYDQIGEEKTDPENSVSVEQFLSHVEEFKKKGYHVAYLGHHTKEKIIATSDQRMQSTKRKYVYFTFDGVHSSFYKEAFPVFKKLRWPFILFLNTAKIGTDPNYLTWEELEEIASYPKSIIACQTHTGKSLLGMSIEEAFEEIVSCLVTVKKRLNVKVRFFSYPKGEFDKRSFNFIRTFDRGKIRRLSKYIFKIRETIMDLDFPVDKLRSNDIFKYAFTEVPNVYNNSFFLKSNYFLLPRIKMNFYNSSQKNALDFVNDFHLPMDLYPEHNYFIDSSYVSPRHPTFTTEVQKSILRVWVSSPFKDQMLCYDQTGKVLEKISMRRVEEYENKSPLFSSPWHGLYHKWFLIEFKLSEKLRNLKIQLVYCTHPYFKKGQVIKSDDGKTKDVTIKEDLGPFRNYYYIIHPE